MSEPMDQGVRLRLQESETFTEAIEAPPVAEMIEKEDCHQSATFTESILVDHNLDKENNADIANGKETILEGYNNEDVTKPGQKVAQLPLGRVKHIMKMDPDTKMASQEAVFLIAKLTELFVESLAKESFSYTSQNKKKTLSKLDVDRAIDAVDCLAFLEGALDD